MSEQSPERQHLMAESRVCRLLLAALDENDGWSADAIARVALEFDGDADRTLEVVLVLVGMLVGPISRSQLRDQWLVHLSQRLSALLIDLGAEP